LEFKTNLAYTRGISVDDLRKGGGLTCARAAGEGDAGDILIHL